MEKFCDGCCETQPKISMKWFFIPLGCVAFLLASLLSLAIWLMEPRLREISLLLWYGVVGLWSLFLVWNAVALVVFFNSTKSSLLSVWAWKLITFLFRLFMIEGWVPKSSFIKIQQAAIQFSNYSFLKKKITLPPEKVLILVPHCIQKDTCNLKVTIDAQNCARCGQCNVGELADLAKETGVHLAIVPGGTLARKRIKEIRPKAVLAIACERDLTSGIQDVFPIPVFGVLNMRPYGPCVNTQVDMNEVRKAIESLVIKEK